VGGTAGLFRFDGWRFEPFRSLSGDPLPSNNIHALFAPPAGGLWIGYTFGGCSFLNKGRLTNYTSDGDPSGGSVNVFAQDRDGVLWAGTTGGRWRFVHGAGNTWERKGTLPTGTCSIRD
jgi:ligand-binding sensor domain-containing protein